MRAIGIVLLLGCVACGADAGTAPADGMGEPLVCDQSSYSYSDGPDYYSRTRNYYGLVDLAPGETVTVFTCDYWRLVDNELVETREGCVSFDVSEAEEGSPVSLSCRHWDVEFEDGVMLAVEGGQDIYVLRHE